MERRVHIVGGVRVEVDSNGSLVIGRAEDEHHDHVAVIEKAHIEDLMVALDAALQEQAAEPKSLTEVVSPWIVEAADDLANAIAINTGRSPHDVEIVIGRDLGIALGIPPNQAIKIRTAAGPLVVRNGQAWTSMPWPEFKQREWKRSYLGQFVDEDEETRSRLESPDTDT